MAERLFKQQMDPCVLDNLFFSRIWISSLSLGKTRKEQSGDANETEKAAMRSVLGTLGYLARESRPDLSGTVSILQRRLSRAQVSDIQETNRVVRLAKAHTDPALPVCRVPVDQICLVSYGVHDHVCGHVIAGRIGISCKSGVLEISV